jgi:phosphate uptake regulator
MLEAIRKLWEDDSVMVDVLRMLAHMVDDAKYVYTHAWEVCTGQAVAEKTEAPLREHDKAVNRSEREVRRKVLGHLSINPGKDVSGCMAVMIIARDVERLGDHCRNIYGVGARLPAPVTTFALFKEFDALQRGIEEQFDPLKRAILDSNEKVAHEILERYQALKKQGKALQDKLFTTNMASGEAVASTLLTRFFLRINAHIGNATSGVIFPLENIDFVSRGLRQEEAEK